MPGPFKLPLYCKNFTTTKKGGKCLKKKSPKRFILILSADKNAVFPTDQIYQKIGTQAPLPL